MSRSLARASRAELIEVLAHGIEDSLAGGDHVVADVPLFLKRVTLWRVHAKIRAEVRHVLGLAEFGHLSFANHGLNLLPMPSTLNGGAEVVRIQVRIIPKGAFSSEVKRCADFSNTPLLTCGFIAFWVRV